MSYSRISYSYTGQTTFAINFTLGYLDESHVTARVNEEEDGSGNPLYRTITFITEGTCSISGSWGPGDTVVFERTVPKDELQHDYQDGAPIVEQNLDDSNKQALMAAHEALDGRFSVLEQSLDMGANRITNLADGIDDGDAVTISQVGNAAAEADAAEASANAAAVSESAAAVSAANALVSENNAESWAASVNLPALGSAYETLVVNPAGTALEYKKSFDVARLSTSAIGQYSEIAHGNGLKDTVDNLMAYAPKPGLVLLASATASNSASVEFPSGIDSTYDEYEIHIVSLVASVDGVTLRIRTSTDGGTTYDSGAADYDWAINYHGGSSTNGDDDSSGDSSISVVPSVAGSLQLGNAAGESLSGRVLIKDPSNTSLKTLFEGECCYVMESGEVCGCEFAGSRLSAADIDAIQFLMSSGNIASGEFRLYGVRK